MERLKAFVYGELANAVFVGPADAEKADMLNILGVNAVLLPDEPVDQIIGIMLYCKLNAIMEDETIDCIHHHCLNPSRDFVFFARLRCL